MHWRTTTLATILFALLASASTQQQPFLSDAPTPAMVLIADVLARREINIFAGLIRDDAAVSAQLSDSGFNATVLAPRNGAMAKMPRKPWEDAAEYTQFGASAYEGADGAGRAAENLKRFVQAHVVPRSPWGSGERAETLAGREVWWEMKDGKQIIQPDGIEVENVADRVANGEVWVLGGVMKV